MIRDAGNTASHDQMIEARVCVCVRARARLRAPQGPRLGLEAEAEAEADAAAAAEAEAELAIAKHFFARRLPRPFGGRSEVCSSRAMLADSR